MNELVCSGPWRNPQPQWSLLFAQDVDQDLDFDEGLEDDELYQRKPRGGRPILWILILLLAVGVVYWALGPDFSFLTDEESPPDAFSPPRMERTDLGQQNVETLPTITVPTPVFREGQEVELVQKSGQNTLSARLLSDASGTQPGPLVKVGETLNVLDGEMVGEGWVYKVRTQSGATGWVSEKSLRKKSP